MLAAIGQPGGQIPAIRKRIRQQGNRWL